jgi:hypothetical protein
MDYNHKGSVAKKKKIYGRETQRVTTHKSLSWHTANSNTVLYSLSAIVSLSVS